MSEEYQLVSNVELSCPWCSAPVSFVLAADEMGQFTEDCEVCCRPWRVRVERDFEGKLDVFVERE